ncbi:MAG: biotin transporter BioY [Treponema sp.]|nr:biotin transporter BioY [Treponema sp.]
MKLKEIRNRYVFASLFAALIAVSSFFIIPVASVPIVFKNLFVVLAGTVLGSFYGGIALLIFITAGLIGAPVFVIPGPAAFSTPLGGYIIGYFLGSLCAGLICGLPKTSERKICIPLVLKITLASFLGFSLILICGLFYMMHLNSMSFASAFFAGVVPFIPGDILKLAISIPLALKLRPVAAKYINNLL